MCLKYQINQEYKPLIDISIKLNYFAKTMVKTSPKIFNAKDGVACYMMAKAFKTHGIIIKLAREGFSEDAEMLSRTLFDVALIITTCLKDKSDDTVLKYLSFDYPTRNKMFKQLQKNKKFEKYFEKRRKKPKPRDESPEEIDQKAEQFIDKYGGSFRQQWYGNLTTGGIAKSVNLSQYFDTAWQLQSQLIHSNPRCMNRYLHTKDDQIKMFTDPSKNEVALPLVSSFNMMFVTCEEFRKYFNLPSREKMENLVNELAKSVKKL